MLSERLADLPVCVSSAGTHAREGMPMTEEAIRLAVARGVDPSKPLTHSARLLTPEMLDEADLILTMTRDHRRLAVELLPAALRRTLTIREFSRLAAGAAEAEIRSTPALGSRDNAARSDFESALAMLTALRGVVGSPAAATDDDVVDPFRRSWTTYERSASELDPGLFAVEKFVRSVAASFSES
ncbi:low molecular weight phosphatase family protein [Microbacterium testaceum]|uniref:arsenate reductase/protein-tyrosine-phosphatase family protein n=1 Tax=Microbacterium testaceum TaxID=2033 RepID=UPI003EBC1143